MEISKKEAILNKLFALHRFGIKPGLERTFELLDKLDNPQNKIKTVHVAGTNGKGSACSTIASVLTEAGFKVGLYTSPHIFEFNERIRINGVMISDDSLVRLATNILSEAEELKATFFEITTAVAFAYFVEQKVDIAIIETGMGGRFDSTNVVIPEVSVITTIDLDHKEYLGGFIEDIAYQKAGIIKKNIPCVISDDKFSLRKVFTGEAEKNDSEVYFATEIVSAEVTEYMADLTMYVNVKTKQNAYKNLNCKLAGAHQVTNLKATILALELLQRNFNWSEENLRNGLAKVYENTGLIGRIEVMSLHPLIILDVSHNPASTKALTSLLVNCGYGDMKFDIIFGAMEDKDYKTMLQNLFSLSDKLILTKPKIERAEELDRLEKEALTIGFNSIEKISSVQKAVKYAIDSEKPIIICGSFYLAGESMEVLENYLAANNLDMF